MHMASHLISGEVGAVMCAVSAAANVYAARKLGKDDLRKLSVTAAAGAAVFAAQMLNFAIPGVGASGHIVGGILLSALVGGPMALLAMTAVILAQCVFFADGGLLALGCNVFNMGVIPCLLVWPILQKISKKDVKPWQSGGIAAFAAIISIQLGAFCVAVQTAVSGTMPFGTFLSHIMPVHLAIGLAEGAITAVIIAFARKTPIRKPIAVLTAAALIAGFGLSRFASEKPDGLEWSIIQTNDS